MGIENKKYSFLVIDDSSIDAMIVRKVIDYSGFGREISIFDNAENALEHIASGISDSDPFTIILLDIMMPVMDGFEFLTSFVNLPPVLQERYRIFILSLSNNPYTLKRLESYPFIRGIIEKPITVGKLKEVMTSIDQE